MLFSIRRLKLLLIFFNRRLEDYTELARLDLVTFRNEMISAIVGAAIGAAACLFLLCFICAAVLLTVWDTGYRIPVAWGICVTWGILTGACILLARRLMRGTSPFTNTVSEIAQDLSAIKHPEGYLNDEFRPAPTTIADNAVDPVGTRA
jgi:hypothetical protein